MKKQKIEELIAQQFNEIKISELSQKTFEKELAFAKKCEKYFCPLISATCTGEICINYIAAHRGRWYTGLPKCAVYDKEIYTGKLRD